MPARRQTLKTQHRAVEVQKLAIVAERDRPYPLARSGQCDDGIGRAEIDADRAAASHIAFPRIRSMAEQKPRLSTWITVTGPAEMGWDRVLLHFLHLHSNLRKTAALTCHGAHGAAPVIDSGGSE